MPPKAYDWYKQLTTVGGGAIVAVGAFLSYAKPANPANILAYVAIAFFFVSIGTSVLGMYFATFRESIPSKFFVAFPTFLLGLLIFFFSVAWHFVHAVAMS